MLSDKILVVDDDPRVISSVKLVLNEYEIIGFEGGKKALEYLKKPHEVSLVLLDVFMRDVDGLSVLSEIKKNNKSLHVIIMTAFGSMDLAVQALRYRADDFIEKPFDLDELRDKVRGFLKECSYLKGASNDHDRVDRIKRFVERNYRNISLESIAEEMCLSMKYLSRMFKEENKSSFRDYKVRVKMNKAKALLESTSYTISQIAERIGYQNPESFMRIFKRITKNTPTQYRKKSQNQRKKILKKSHKT